MRIAVAHLRPGMRFTASAVNTVIDHDWPRTQPANRLWGAGRVSQPQLAYHQLRHFHRRAPAQRRIRRTQRASAGHGMNIAAAHLRPGMRIGLLTLSRLQHEGRLQCSYTAFYPPCTGREIALVHSNNGAGGTYVGYRQHRGDAPESGAGAFIAPHGFLVDIL